MTEQTRDKTTFDYLYNTIDKRATVKGITPVDMLSFPNSLSGLFDNLMRSNNISLTDAATELNVSPDEAHQLMNMLAQKGYLRVSEESSEVVYQIRFAAKRKRRLPPNLWQALDS